MICPGCKAELTLDDLIVETHHWEGGSLSRDSSKVICKFCKTVLKESVDLYDTDLYKQYGRKLL